MVCVTERLIGRSLEGSHEDGLQNVFDGEVTDVAHGAVKFGDRGEMTVDCALLGTQLLGRAVGVENFHSVSERGPEILKAVIKDVFKRVVVVLVQCHPGIFFRVVDRKVCLGYKSNGEGAVRENPVKLDAEYQEKAVDTATFKYCIIRWKVGFAPGVMTVVIAVGNAARATAESTTSSRNVILVVRHVDVAVSKTWKIHFFFT